MLLQATIVRHYFVKTQTSMASFGPPDLSINGMYRVSQKNVVSWKNSHNYPQTHPKWKIQDICYHMGTEIFKIEEERK